MRAFLWTVTGANWLAFGGPEWTLAYDFVLALLLLLFVCVFASKWWWLCCRYLGNRLHLCRASNVGADLSVSPGRHQDKQPISSRPARQNIHRNGLSARSVSGGDVAGFGSFGFKIFPNFCTYCMCWPLPFADFHDYALLIFLCVFKVLSVHSHKLL